MGNRKIEEEFQLNHNLCIYNSSDFEEVVPLRKMSWNFCLNDDSFTEGYPLNVGKLQGIERQTLYLIISQE
jgi:hypothetical protein